MTNIIVSILATLGTAFVLLAAVGILRMPDTYLRMAVTTKAATLGVGLILLAAAVCDLSASGTLSHCEHPVYFSHQSNRRAPYRKSFLYQGEQTLGRFRNGRPSRQIQANFWEGRGAPGESG